MYECRSLRDPSIIGNDRIRRSIHGHTKVQRIKMENLKKIKVGNPTPNCSRRLFSDFLV